MTDGERYDLMIDEIYELKKENKNLKREVERLTEELENEKDKVEMGDTIILKFWSVMDDINNTCVEWQECGPYEDANTESLNLARKIYKLSSLPERKVVQNDKT